MAQQLAEKRIPVVIKGTQVKGWKALKEWTPEYLSHALGTLSNGNLNGYTFN
jgi:hypothetical protein